MEKLSILDESESVLKKHRINFLEIPLLEKYLKPIVNGKRILDIGCGKGRYPKLFIDWGASHVTGIDIDEKSLAKCNDLLTAGKESPTLPLEFKQLSYNDMNFNNEYDILTSTFSLFFDDSIEKLKKTFSNIFQALKPGGTFFALTIDFEQAEKMSNQDKEERTKKLGSLWEFDHSNPQDGSLAKASFYDEHGTQIHSFNPIFWSKNVQKKVMEQVGFNDIRIFTLEDFDIVKEKFYENKSFIGMEQDEVYENFRLAHYMVIMGQNYQLNQVQIAAASLGETYATQLADTVKEIFTPTLGEAFARGLRLQVYNTAKNQVNKQTSAILDVFRARLMPADKK